MGPTTKDYKALEKAVKEMKIKGYKYLGGSWASFNGVEIDLSTASPNPLAIAYATLKQLHG